MIYKRRSELPMPKFAMYTKSEWIEIKRLQEIAERTKDLKPIKKSVLKEVNQKLKIHEN